MLYDQNIIRTSSEIFGYLRHSSVIFGKCSENVRRRSPSFRNNFGKSWEIFGKWSEIYGTSSKTSLLVCLYNKQNNTWTLGDMEFIFLCSHLISHSFASLTRSISMWTLEDKFHISARPCIILYIFSPPCNILYFFFASHVFNLISGAPAARRVAKRSPILKHV